MLIIDTQYFAPVIIYKNSIEQKYITIEQYEHWQKLGFRNRCVIAGANGLINLSIPVAGGRHSKHLIRDVKIDNNAPWQMIHWRSIISAYNRSPWFDQYKDEIEVFYNANYIWLRDWNLSLFEWSLKKLGFQPEIRFTENWKKDYPEDEGVDFRGKVLPNNYETFAADCPVYRQVFEDRHGFFPNLSIIDLLFCEGPHAAQMLKD